MTIENKHNKLIYSLKKFKINILFYKIKLIYIYKF